MVRVQAVAPDSLGAELGLVPGTDLLAVNGRQLEDFLDWEFLAADDRFLLHARLPTGEEIEYDVERPEDLPLGVRLEAPRIRRCANRCDFCFVDGNPAGLRPALYIRRRLPALLPLRQLRDPDQPQAVGRGAHRGVPVVAAVRLGSRHEPRRAPLAAP